MKFISRRFYSSVIEKTVMISRSTDVFENLALEHWYYQHSDFTNKSMLLLWMNSNCVVIGRHQNPWLEINFDPDSNVQIARRNSGGGTVFHDCGNLNMTFFTHRNVYNRKKNLELIVETLKTEWNVVTEINEREDIVIENKYKVKGFSNNKFHPLPCNKINYLTSVIYLEILFIYRYLAQLPNWVDLMHTIIVLY